MENYYLWAIGGGVLALLVVALIWSHAGMLKKSVDAEWDKLRNLLSVRHDFLPNLIETVRKFAEGQDGLIQNVIDAREKAEHVHIPGLNKFEAELELSKAAKELVGLVGQFPMLGKDTNYLELKEDLKKVAQEIEMQTDRYNGSVRKYNSYVKYIPFKKKANIFLR